ncbi:unnamed protein product [Phytophthora fragariaefolia]|uniref:Unnamed protein product n=1 Tax=Phytophthora fragariaefolia TaxID=1490495 RepID=A0A9W6XXP8_9STRA|nr:unnamed protein product [Phytophthora fragariaefolia]
MSETFEFELASSSDSSSEEEATTLPGSRNGKCTYDLAGKFSNKADCNARMEEVDGSRYKFQYNTSGIHTKRTYFVCCTHNNCGSVMRRTQIRYGMFVLEITGANSSNVDDSEVPLRATHGIHRAIKGEVDNLLAGLGPEADLSKFSEKTFDYQCELLVLDAFCTGEMGTKDESLGVVISFRRLFRNVPAAIRGQHDTGVLAVIDGTYKIHAGGWTLIDLGTCCVGNGNSGYNHTFVPWVYFFVRSETSVAYQKLFECVKIRTREFFGLITTNWISLGELDFTAWISEQYLTDPWDGWFITASSEAGVIPNQNAIESHHKSMKMCTSSITCCNIHCDEPISSECANTCQPKMATRIHIPVFASGPIDPDMVQKAQLLIEKCNFRKGFARRSHRKRVIAILFNTSKFIIFKEGSSLHGMLVDEARARVF